MTDTQVAKPSSHPETIAVAQRKEKETKRAGHLYVMAATAYSAIREFESSVGGKEMDFWDDLNEKDQDFWKDAAKWVMRERNVKANAADLQDEYPVAGSTKSYRNLTIEERTRCYLFVAIIRAFTEIEDQK